MRPGGRARAFWIFLAVSLCAGLTLAGFMAPDFVSSPVRANAYLGPLDSPPFGTDNRGIALVEYALQGAKIVALPSLAAGLVVMIFAVIAGTIRCAGMQSVDTVIQGLSEIVGALPRLVVVLVAALMLPNAVMYLDRALEDMAQGAGGVTSTMVAIAQILMPNDSKSLMPIAIVWAFLAAPGAMDEAAATAGRLGGARFVEALRAHGFSAPRIYLYHVIWLNLRPVIFRQGAEVTMQVVFLEIALSYLAVSTNEPSFTHPESTYSWATLLYQGFTALMGENLYHSMWTGLFLVAMVALMAQSVRLAARAR